MKIKLQTDKAVGRQTTQLRTLSWTDRVELLRRLPLFVLAKCGRRVDSTCTERYPPTMSSGENDLTHYRFFGSLESLRGICAVGVVCLHFPWATAYRRVPALQQSWLFVDLFFVLSGFVIAHVYLDKLNRFSDVADFAIKRLFRLYPLHILALALCGALIVGKSALGLGYDAQSTVGRVLAAVTLTHGIGFNESLPLNSPSWSISAEMAAYAVFALCCLMTRHRVAALIVVSLGALLVEVIFNDATLDGGMTFRAFRCFYSFGIGVMTWRFAPRLDPRLQWPAAAAIGVLMWVSASETQWTLAVPMATALLVGTLTHDGSLARLLLAPPLKAIGRWSYSIYLMHSFILTVVGFALNRVVTARIGTQPYLPLAQDMGLGATVIALVILVSALTYRFVEVPGRDAGRRLLDRRRAIVLREASEQGENKQRNADQSRAPAENDHKAPVLQRFSD